MYNYEDFFQNAEMPYIAAKEFKGGSVSQNRNDSLRKKYNELYWAAHPSGYVSIWMKHHFFTMEPEDFVAKYLIEMQDESISKPKRESIASVILPMYKELTGKEYGTDQFKDK